MTMQTNDLKLHKKLSEYIKGFNSWDDNASEVVFEDLVGKTIKAVERNNEKLIFLTNEDIFYVMYHEQDCCEDVSIEDIEGDLDDLIGQTILVATEETNSGTNENHDSYTWTYYKIGTIKGWIDIRWFGSSNGYYSEAVSFLKITPVA